MCIRDRYNYDQQANKTIYAIDARGRFDVAPLDRVLYQPPDGTQHTGIVIEHTLKSVSYTHLDVYKRQART